MEFVRIADKKRVEFITCAISRFAPGSSILDIGCGNGIISKAIASIGYKVTGIDVSEKTIAEARTFNSHPDIEFKVIPAGELRPEPSKYHAIICSEVLEHLTDPLSLLGIIHSSLKEDGTLIVTVPNGRGPRELFITRPVQYIQKKDNFLSRSLTLAKKKLGYSGTTVQSSADDLSHVQFFTPRTLRRLATSAGFQIDIIKKTNFMEQVFPFSLLTRKNLLLQKMDCALAELLPLGFTSGFMTIWKKSRKSV